MWRYLRSGGPLSRLARAVLASGGLSRLQVLCTHHGVTPAKIEHEYRLYRDGELLTEARSVLACVDRAGAVQRIPEAFH